MANLNPFGAFAEGLVSGLHGAQRLRRERQAADLADLQMEEIKRQREQEQAIRQAAAQGYGLDAVPTSGVEGVTPGSQQDQMLAEQTSGLETARTVENPIPRGKRLIASMEAAMGEAFKQGRTDLAADYFAKAHTIRQSILQRELDEATRRYEATKDPSVFFKAYNEWVADGRTLEGVGWVMDAENGERKYRVKVAEDGKTRVLDVPEGEIPKYVQALRDPQKILDLEMERVRRFLGYQDKLLDPDFVLKQRDTAARERAAAANERRAEASETQAQAAMHRAAASEKQAQAAIKRAETQAQTAIQRAEKPGSNTVDARQRANLIVNLMKMRDEFGRPLYPTRAAAEAEADAILGTERAQEPNRGASANRPPLDSFLKKR